MALVTSPVQRSSQPEVARLLMSVSAGLEQVGFVERTGRGVRLQMMGGEFCGTGACAFAWYVAGGRPGSLLVEVSGAPVLRAVVGAGVVALETPILRSARVLAGSATLVSLHGISHVVVDGVAPVSLEAAAREHLSTLRLLDLPAAGVVFWRSLREGEVAIEPVVHVRDTRTLLHESACGSGSVCLAARLGRDRGPQRLAIRQPSGRTIVVETGSIAPSLVTMAVPIGRPVPMTTELGGLVR
ncbi:hypothetical protein GCM10010402_65810 [Actinomadura luteofluorescens]|uniref:hypothetical protein n=1 Tax=Actinomadura luteofluorescens TaxID=46163 RepID=UPI002164ADB8|nr:hypothetical protein [Actinomadura glauciflava]MCR3737509.1 Diaminopimelate epimerase [Actinomadura glauciflava]